MFSYDESTLRSADGTKLFCRRWKPDEPKAVLVFVHGVGEHSGRYIHVSEWFASRGYACYAYDYRGHGQAGGERGDIQEYGEYLDDLVAVIESARGDHPRLKLFTVGHSQGGTIILAHALDHPEEVDGVIASAPALGVYYGDLPAWKVWIAKLAPRLEPLVPGLTLGNGIVPEYLSHDPAVAEAYTSDPLVHDRAVLRWFVEYLRTHQRLLAEAAQFSVPCLIVQGTDDHLAPLEKTKQFYANLTLPDKQLKLYDGFYHEAFNEVEKERVFEDVEQWLAPRVQGS